MKDKRKQQGKTKEQQAERITRRIAVSLLLVSLFGFAYWQLQQWFMDPDTLPIKIVRIDGDMKYLKKAQLENAIASRVSGGFFNIDLQHIKHAAKQLAWVDDISVKRVWPDTLLMSIKEKVAIARWGKKQLVTGKGEIFLPPDVMPEGLPLLKGPDERVEELVTRFNTERQRFVQQDLHVTELAVNERGAWSMRFREGLTVAVGRDDVELRLDRLARYLNLITKLKGMPESIDLRYRDGMAILWKQVEAQDKEVINGEGAV